MTSQSSNLPVRDRQALDVERAQRVPDTTLRTCMTALHDSFIQDEEIDDALDMVMGKESALLTRQELDELLPRLRKHLRQLLRIANQRVTGERSRKLAEVAVRWRQLDATPAPQGFPEARGYARRLALATQDVLEVLDVEEEAARAVGRWSG
ncbi:DUF6415 family natural product biosynthesis protein [Streptomyces sp. NPDC006990]|uniref:DUF6415 family natural product biosynthesis protein n=1 Tax=Streptomyces sp. NPDC006990 TaxID=3154481 RepID=UPI003454CF8B